MAWHKEAIVTGETRGPRPAYGRLPLLVDDADERHAWEYWGKGDPLGCLNDITLDARLRGLATVTLGRSISIVWPLDLPSPPMFGRKPYEHTFFPPSKRNFVDDKIDNLYPQASTQWDGFRHLLIPGHGYFGGVDPSIDFSADRDVIGIHHWAKQGIISRGVLIDVSDRILAGLRADPDAALEPVEIDELRAAVKVSGVELLPGDILCVRSGWTAYYGESDLEERNRIGQRFTWPGLSGSSEMAEYLWDSGISALVVDNPGVEASPGSRAKGSLHRRCLALLGMPFGEIFDFEELSVELTAIHRREFLFVAVPLNLPGGVGSTGNAVAIV
jgi:kynurenine formamidase